jgi:hypothetical protein
MATRRNNVRGRLDFGSLLASQVIRVLRIRYGVQLPDDDAGRDDARLVLGYLANVPRASKRMQNFCQVWAPWLDDIEREQMLQEAATSRPLRFTPDQLAERLGVTLAERTALRLTCIGAIDCSKAEREMRRKALAKARQQRRRRSRGVRARAQYLAASISRTKPWEAAGISRRTWYRRQSAAAE